MHRDWHSMWHTRSVHAYVESSLSMFTTVSVLDSDLLTVNSSNSSLNGSITFEQNPYTETIIIVLLVAFIFILAIPSLFINFSLTFAFIKTKQLLKPLGILHASLFIEVFLNKLSFVIILCLFYPPVLRTCSCSRALSTLFFSSRVFVVCFRPVMYACISVSQLLITMGKKRYVNYKTVAMFVVLAVSVGILFATESAVLFNINGELFGCNDFCPGQMAQVSFPSINIVLISYIVTVWIPSFITLVIASVWTCATFKKHYIGEDNQLNKRLISMPIILPIVLVGTTILSVIIRRIVVMVIGLFDLEFVDYWFFLSGAAITLMHEITDGVLYQLLLSYLNPQLFKTWKSLFHRQPSNQVHPSTTLVVTSVLSS